LKVVLEADLNPVVVSWDACIPFEISLDRIQNFESQTPEGRFFVDITNAFMDLYGSKNKSDFELCDPLTVMAYLGYGKIRAEKINVITEENYYGKTYSDPDGFAVRYFYTENNEEVEHIIQSMLDILEVKTKNKVYA
jgi:inosine-uridine nucleoside N-ribohydrolase